MNTAYRTAFREWFGVPPAEADILVALYTARGGLMRDHQIAKFAAISLSTVKRRICTLREALESEAIDCERGAGYRLTDTGMAECRAVLWQMGEELRAAS